MAKKTNQPNDMANDVAGLVLEGTKKWTRLRRPKSAARLRGAIVASG